MSNFVAGLVQQYWKMHKYRFISPQLVQTRDSGPPRTSLTTRDALTLLALNRLEARPNVEHWSIQLR